MCCVLDLYLQPLPGAGLESPSSWPSGQQLFPEIRPCRNQGSGWAATLPQSNNGKHRRNSSSQRLHFLSVYGLYFIGIFFYPKVVLNTSDRSLGSIDVVAAARSVLQIERNAENMDVRVVHQIKNSLGPDGSKISFSITEDYGFQWLDSISESCEEKQNVQAIECTTKTEMACALLKQYLIKGDMASKEIYERLGEAGISRRTIAETKRVLGIQSYRRMRQWYWTLKE